MTTEAFEPSPVQIISGVGPYDVTHPYREGTLRLAVWKDGIRTDLGEGDFTVTPAAAAEQGTVTLSALVAAAQDGGRLYIARETSPEQGWEGVSSRERGLEAQLDWLTQGIQDVNEVIGRSLRAPLGDDVDLELPPAADRALGALIFDATGRPTTGTLATSELLVSAYVQSLLASADPATFAAAMQENLAGIAATSFGNNEAPIFKDGAWDKFTASPFMRSVLVAADAPATREALGATSGWELVGEIYRNTTDGNVTGVASGFWEDGWEYLYVISGISSTATSTLRMQVERETDLVFTNRVDIAGSNFTSNERYYGDVIVKLPRIEKHLHVVNADIFSSDGAVTDSSTAFIADTYSGFTHATAQKLRRIRFDFSSGDFDRGIITEYRRRAGGFA